MIGETFMPKPCSLIMRWWYNISKIAPCLLRLFYLLVFPQELSSFLDASCSNLFSFYNLFDLRDITQRARFSLLHGVPAHCGTEPLHTACTRSTKCTRRARR